MPETPLLSPEEFQRRFDLVDEIAARYHRDPSFRAQVSSDPRAALQEVGMSVPPDMEVRVVANTNDVAYLVMPPDPNIELTDEALTAVSGGSSVGTAGSAGTISTFSSVPSSWSSVATAGTVGTAGSN